jgi:hypothetical protein
MVNGIDIDCPAFMRDMFQPPVVAVSMNCEPLDEGRDDNDVEPVRLSSRLAVEPESADEEDDAPGILSMIETFVAGVLPTLSIIR